jgi:hypothetical protein
MLWVPGEEEEEEEEIQIAAATAWSEDEETAGQDAPWGWCKKQSHAQAPFVRRGTEAASIRRADGLGRPDDLVFDKNLQKTEFRRL